MVSVFNVIRHEEINQQHVTFRVVTGLARTNLIELGSTTPARQRNNMVDAELAAFCIPLAVETLSVLKLKQLGSFTFYASPTTTATFSLRIALNLSLQGSGILTLKNLVHRHRNTAPINHVTFSASRTFNQQKHRVEVEDCPEDKPHIQMDKSLDLPTSR